MSRSEGSPADYDCTTLDLDALIVLAARLRSGLRKEGKSSSITVTPKAAAWAACEVCHPPASSIRGMLKVHARSRLLRTDFVAGDGPGKRRTVCLRWFFRRQGGLDLVMSFEDEGRVRPFSGTGS